MYRVITPQNETELVLLLPTLASTARPHFTQGSEQDGTIKSVITAWWLTKPTRLSR